MGLLDLFKKKSLVESETETELLEKETVPVEKPSNSSQQMIKLTKSKEDLNHVINLTKEKDGIDLTTVKASIAVVMDISGSMEWQYKNGNVQNILTRLFPFALNFDDDGELDVFVFANNCQKVPVPMVQENFEKYVKNNILNRYSYGGTYYAPAIKKISETYKNKKKPSLIFFITDGDNSDKTSTTKEIIASANQNSFIEFIGIGNDNFKYLKSLDDLKGRSCDNTGFMAVENFEKIENIKVFQQTLSDYIPWLKFKGYIK